MDAKDIAECDKDMMRQLTAGPGNDCDGCKGISHSHSCEFNICTATGERCPNAGKQESPETCCSYVYVPGDVL